MVPKNNRLKSDEDFKSVFAGGKTSQNKFLRIKFVKNNEKSTRFGFIVSLKFAKEASKRNLIKRRLRAAISFLLQEIKPGYDIIIWPLAIAKEADYQSLLDSLKDLFKKNDILFI